MYRVIASLVSILLFMSLPPVSYAEDFAAVCEAHLLPSSVEVLPMALVSTDVEYVPASYLKEQDKKTGAAFSQAGIIFGLTRSRPDASYEYKIDYVQKKDTGEVCYRIQAVAKIGYSPLKTFVADESKNYSCLHAAILKHEGEHTEIYRRYLPTVVAEVSEEVNADVGQKVRFAASLDGAYAAAEDTLNSVLQKIATPKLNAVAVANNSFDNQEEGRAFTHCGTEEQELVRLITTKNIALRQ